MYARSIFHRLCVDFVSVLTRQSSTDRTHKRTTVYQLWNRAPVSDFFSGPCVGRHCHAQHSNLCLSAPVCPEGCHECPISHPRSPSPHFTSAALRPIRLQAPAPLAISLQYGPRHLTTALVTPKWSFTDAISGIELTEAGVPYVLRGQTEYTILSFYRVIKRPTDTQAKRASTAVQTIDPKSCGCSKSLLRISPSHMCTAPCWLRYSCDSKRRMKPLWAGPLKQCYFVFGVRDQAQVWMTARPWLGRERPTVGSRLRP